MRIVSLVPHATEMLFALGLGDRVVGVTHECDYPERTADIPKVTRDVLPSGLGPAEIDAAVKERTRAGEAIYVLDEKKVRELAPDLIVTQELCPVCAVSYDEVKELAERIDPCPKVVSLDPKTFGETMADIRRLAEVAEVEDAAEALVARQTARVDRVLEALDGVERRTVAAIEWLDPVYVAGHWTPQLIEMAGGVDVLGFAGESSTQSDWEAVAAARPEVLLCIPCGYDAQDGLEQARRYQEQLRSTGAREILVLDASAYFSRPGPRLVDGLETLAHALHPDRVPEAPGEVLRL